MGNNYRGLLFCVVFLSGSAVSLSGSSSGSARSNSTPGLQHNLTVWFSNAAGSCRTGQWSRRLQVYRAALVQFAKLVRDNAQAEQGPLRQKLLGTASGLMDIHFHISLLEGRIYQGEWMRHAGKNLQRVDAAVWARMRSRLQQGLLEYYRIDTVSRAAYLNRLFSGFAGLLSGSSGDPFLAGYRSALLRWGAFNRLLDGRIPPQLMAADWLQMLQGTGPVQGSSRR